MRAIALFPVFLPSPSTLALRSAPTPGVSQREVQELLMQYGKFAQVVKKMGGVKVRKKKNCLTAGPRDADCLLARQYLI